MSFKVGAVFLWGQENNLKLPDHFEMIERADSFKLARIIGTNRCFYVQEISKSQVKLWPVRYIKLRHLRKNKGLKLGERVLSHKGARIVRVQQMKVGASC